VAACRRGSDTNLLRHVSAVAARPAEGAAGQSVGGRSTVGRGDSRAQPPDPVEWRRSRQRAVRAAHRHRTALLGHRVNLIGVIIVTLTVAAMNTTGAINQLRLCSTHDRRHGL